MIPEDRQLRTLDLPMGEGRATLRLALMRDESGAPEALVLSCGFGVGDGFHRHAWNDLPIRLPGSILPELRRALDVLGEVG